MKTNDFKKQALEGGAIDLTLATSYDHDYHYDRANNSLCRVFELDGKKYYQEIRVDILKSMIQWAESVDDLLSKILAFESEVLDGCFDPQTLQALGISEVYEYGAEKGYKRVEL